MVTTDELSTEVLIRVAHLDDDALYLDQFADALERSSKGHLRYVVQSTSDPDEYLGWLGFSAPDVAVLDVNLGTSGRGEDVAKKTKELAPGTVVFMCSELKDLTSVSACLRAGADDFIFKGSDEQELALRIYGAWRLRRPSPVARRPEAGLAGKTMTELGERVPRILDSAIQAVHIQGESGTGKELVSELIERHLAKGTPFVRVNCGAIAPSLLESELFGHVRGAFTGALTEKAGLLEAAHGGWIFLDEVQTLTPSAQVALLRVLENHRVRRVGGNTERKIALRVLSASNEPLPALVEQGKFRADLWQRLREAVIELKPLRERMNELPDLIAHFCQTMDKGPYRIAPSALEILSAYEWRRGNVRELRNCLRAMTELSVDKLLTPMAIPKHFWLEAEKKSGGPVSEPPSETVARDVVTLRWSSDGPALWDDMSRKLLAAMVEREYREHGPLTLRALSQSIGIPRTTLALRLKEVVASGLVSARDMTHMVGIGKRRGG